jgi:small subunit ribosomal protein S15
MNLTAQAKKAIFAKHGKSEKNTGSAEGQIAMFTERINHLSGHLQGNSKDNSTELALIKLVGKRRALLNYLAKVDIFRYRAIIKELDLRK